jgi:hypothetical protein
MEPFDLHLSRSDLVAERDVAGPLSAFRTWRLEGEELRSPRVGTVWSGRRLHATCLPQTAGDFIREAHAAPAHDCHCGIGADRAPDLAVCEVDATSVIGIVTLWGRLEVSRTGARAEWAEIQALGTHAVWTRRHKTAVARAADGLGVPVLDVLDLESAASHYASPLTSVLPATGGPARPFARRRTRTVFVGA